MSEQRGLKRIILVMSIIIMIPAFIIGWKIGEEEVRQDIARNKDNPQEISDKEIEELLSELSEKKEPIDLSASPKNEPIDLTKDAGFKLPDIPTIKIVAIATIYGATTFVVSLILLGGLLFSLSWLAAALKKK